MTSLNRLLNILSGLRPHWAIDLTSRKGRPALRFFFYSQPAKSASTLDLLETKEKSFSDMSLLILHLNDLVVDILQAKSIEASEALTVP